MIFPDEYKTIGWTEKGKTAPDNQKIYFLSEYILEKTDVGYNLYEIRHKGAGFLREPAESTLIAGDDEVLLCPEEMNIKNRTLLIETADKMLQIENKKRTDAGGKPATTAVFKGFDKHLTFVKDPDVSEILEIQVVDVFPPEPPWLFNCIKRLNASNIFGDLQICFSEKLADLSVYQGEKTIYPCHSSGLRGKFLDSDKLDENESGWLLVGCDTSKQIIETLYPNLKYDFVDMCPMRSDLTKPEKPFIMRCCKSENSGKIIKINGQTGVIVHWGAGEWQIAESVRKLAIELRKTE
ncbi:hypothetical protein MmiHf6_15640 [Methanimicrococcus hongohii]|uniref:Uncharacterized protein n=1 Tax=Methanimicrococcus hongohii TaxID=3028295 RepID=A0AA96V0N6_9EURY|nr:hypothetical protein [Methanimicrococcus sp. Hf6]WNY24234.1 hypothetical protein MmiHf6_15640 [Methanimicrococcus sp. Hf6]